MIKQFCIALVALTFSCSSTKDKGNLTKYERSIEKHRNHIHSEHLSNNGPFRTEEERSKFIGFKYFKTNESYKIMANINPFTQVDTIIMKTSSGQDRPYLKFANVQFDLNKLSHQLTLYKSVGDQAHYFLPFTDETSGGLSYGGGRYLDMDAKKGADSIELDFNKAYNPYCAYVDGYSCPIPPSENHVNTSIEAGVQYQKTVFSK